MKKISSKRTSRRAPRNGRFDLQALVHAAQQAVRAALEQHKRTGNPVAGWVDGRVVLVPPARIKV